jgi:hypothetical protein
LNALIANARRCTRPGLYDDEFAAKFISLRNGLSRKRRTEKLRIGCF